MDRSEEVHKSYFDNGYNTGGTAITEPEIQELYPNMSLADFQGAINLMDQMNNLMSNSTVTASDWLSTVNKVRITGLV